MQLFKEAFINNCTCKGCTDGIIKLVQMPRAVNDKVMELAMRMLIENLAELWDKSVDL